ncbi:hypothetical protein MKW94_003298 [Papaver nudicaule]|uniref:Uncharacterized protein n=1 Tax=Papaver nudicaule TaxID=74823 RepID=A0AA41UY33_PAPNU|nr:hypothetical protein [Papaver nudicaule]
MPSASAAFSCDPGETLTATSSSVSDYKIYCHGCQDQCITQCQSQGREVSQLECNFWGTDPAECKCCCRLPSSTPSPPPIHFNRCAMDEINKYFYRRNSSIDCNICVNECKTRCDGVGATVTRQVCSQDYRQDTKALIDGVLNCPCCCKIHPPPPPPSPSPPPPSPSPPPPPSLPPSPPPPSPSPPPPPPPPTPSPSPPSPPPPSPICPPSPCPCSGNCGVDINIQISYGQAPCKDKLPQSSSSTEEL